MKQVKVLMVLIAAALVTIGMGSTSLAFHSGGVAECGGCHSMHAPKAGGSFLLIGTEGSSTCLSCHERTGDTGPSSYHVSTPGSELGAGQAPKQRTPGGDFGWLKKTYTWTVRGSVTTEDGATHGHNIIAADNGYSADPNNTTAPGGTYPSSQLGCESCHDPHGKARRLSDGSYARGGVIGQATAPIIGSGSYNTSATPAAGQAVGIYRLLAGNGYVTDGVTFTAYPVAVAPSTYNQSEATNQVRVAYGHTGSNTMGNWCATCHGAMHSNGNYVHPVDETLGSDIANIYNAYIKSGDMTGTAANSFLSLVPFAENTGDYSVLKTHASNTNSYLNGPATSDRITCLSCHRSHASAFPEMLRWQNEGELITNNGTWPGTDNGAPVQFARGRTAAEQLAGYYDRPASVFATYQRVLCNKCHAQD